MVGHFIINPIEAVTGYKVTASIFFNKPQSHTTLRRELRSSTLTKHPATSKTDSVTFTLESLTGVEAFANTDKSTGKKYKSNFIIK